MNQCQVEAGETLVSISIRENVSVAVLRRLNKLYGNEIFPGQILTLRSTSRKLVDNPVLRSIYDPIVSALTDRKKPTDNFLSAQDDTTAETSQDMKNSDDTSTKEKISIMSSFDSYISSRPRAVSSSSRAIPLSNKVTETSHIQRTNSTTSIATLSLSYSEKIKHYNEEELEKLIPVLIGNSKILNVEYAKKLRKFLPSMQQIEKWKLLYSVLNNGADFVTFFSKIKGNKYTLIIVETINGEIFGGFNSMQWNISPNFCK
jgi:LysM repeat protein